jgi:hypothetical protein
MSDLLNLNCWVVGDNPQRVFFVEIAKTKMIKVLKKAIKNEMKPIFNDITADSLDLWEVCCGCRYVFDLLVLTISYSARSRSTIRHAEIYSK